jgi:hypothetical protein
MYLRNFSAHHVQRLNEPLREARCRSFAPPPSVPKTLLESVPISLRQRPSFSLIQNHLFSATPFA